MSSPLAIDLFCGLGGWTEGLLAEGYRVVGFDIERHDYGDGMRYPAQLVIQDVRTLHGSQFKNAALIVASPPCQAYSYRAMPWKRAKALPPPDNTLFEACFRIQREACEAAGHHVPLVVENVCGAQKWVGRARWHFGSFYLWGDVPALMPIVVKREAKRPGHDWNRFKETGEVSPHWRMDGADSAVKNPGFRFDGRGKSFQTESVDRATKNNGGSWFNVAHNTTSGKGQNPDGRKVSGDWFGSYADMKAKGTISPGRLHGKNSRKRKAASAAIAKIPFVLARHIAAVYKPDLECAS